MSNVFGTYLVLSMESKMLDTDYKILDQYLEV